MEIERINENTIKFYISYIDIEDRGFEREEIWYNRERSEQLFWQMMDEVNYKEDFNVEGPLWIQVQALEKGLEIIVTKAQISKNGENIELQTEDGNTVDFPVDKKIENMLEDKFGKHDDEETEQEDEEDKLWIIADFSDFEDVIQLSHYFRENHEGTKETLYHYNDKYYLYMEFSEEELDEKEQEDIISKVFEFGNDSDITFHLLEEYGKKIFVNDTFVQIRSHFPVQV
ncbi:MULTISPECIES: adaptor protein MecA [Virgibacillus]|uniref:Adapter protein MecA n=2 Tax=Virgibacillus TaxID=84406 RepID=A0A024QEK9_9BACI|nr:MULTISPECIES: adaptor protein MecA [Virgibacillus]EQB35197.1 adaptor protein [Virgibacillus sp. CM-4]MYL42747.1 adaptor protein MecA [Virgibacillus massiliensis]GGJ69157.1 adapter protein MecA 1 [Virgibacillus kapii]CDQ40640.1 Adapter protein MecA 1 [Virgibacillus massiliensis]